MTCNAPPLRRVLGLAALLSAAALACPPSAAAAPLDLLSHQALGSLTSFCGFYVAGADQDLTNDATMVVLMRDGQRTVLAMQNTYAGPPEDFAMVVPVPTILSEGDVKILPARVFETIDRLASPRLVEYWEQDPCRVGRDFTAVVDPAPTASRDSAGISIGGTTARKYGVEIETQFEVGEYDIAILSARDSTGLEAYLRHENYSLPPGAATLLQPYVEQGQKFFVAKVDIDKVKFVDGRAQLSPLRFHYDSEGFALPVRLGMINSSGTQDLIVHILAREVRYEVANYDNVAIPTNLDVLDTTRQRFGSFYASLFDHTLEQQPGAVITEYAWSSGSCDPCPGPTLTLDDLMLLGADELPSYANSLGGEKVDSSVASALPGEFVLTRLHARYGKGALGQDLVFRAAAPLVGGREQWQGDRMAPESGARVDLSAVNNFQARYAIRHEWEGPVDCEAPRRGQWGGAWPEVGDRRDWRRPQVSEDLAFAERGASLDDFIATVPLSALAPENLPNHAIAAPEPLTAGQEGGCASCRVGEPSPLGALLGLGGLLALFGLGRRRRAVAEG